MIRVRSRPCIPVAAMLAPLLLALASPALAQSAPQPGGVANPPPALAPEPPTPPVPPPGFDARKPLGPDDLARKNEGGYFTGLPLANFDPNTGVGGGARAYYYYNGERSDPLFAYTPYLHRLFLQFFVSSGGLQFHWFDYDAPALFGSNYRIRSQVIFLRNTAQHYFGIDDDALAPLTFTGAGKSYGSYAAYDRDLRRLREDGTTLSRYNHYDLIRPIGIFSIERTFFRGLIRPLVGLGVSYADVRDYTGKRVEAEGGGSAEQGKTLLFEQCEEGLVVGCNGGWDNTLRLGISFDTRDFEPDPNSGVFADLALDLGTPLLGSRYFYARFLASARMFLSPMPSITDLVLAARGTFLAQSQGAPFTSMDTLPYTEDPRAGIGGHRTLRGYQQDRFLGHVLGLVNLEARWTFYRFEALSQKFGLMAVAFLDMGRPFERAKDLSLRNWRRSQGGALRISWNLATIITVDYGFSSEDSGLYINFNHIF